MGSRPSARARPALQSVLAHAMDAADAGLPMACLPRGNVAQRRPIRRQLQRSAMSPGVTAMAIICGIVAIGSLAGFTGSRQKMDLEQWAVAGRGLGVVFVWLLMAGEIYTTFTFLGASGW